MLDSKETTHDFEKQGSGISDVRFSLCTLEKTSNDIIAGDGR